MQIVNLVQGSPEWLAHRTQHFNASDSPAMMGVSPYKTRSQLVHELATGLTADVDSGTQRRFDDGHRAEALARPLAEKIIGEELYPVTGTNGKLSASFDGLTLMYDVAFEHKLANDRLRAAFIEIADDDTAGHLLPIEYRIQLEQQCIVSECERILFMATRWDAAGNLLESMHVWYLPDVDLADKIRSGWAQFSVDLAAYTPPEAAPIVSGKAPESLPALRIEVSGAVTASNLAEFKQTALTAIRGVNRELTTDQHFADAEKAVKWCSDVEERLTAAKQHALSQTASIDELFRTMDEISAEAKRVRLDLDKLVKARKEAIREDIVIEGRKALTAHLEGLNARIGKQYMPNISADFAGAIKGKRTIDSLRDAVNTTLANAKIEASAIADRIQANLTALRERAADHTFLFADIAQIVLRQPDDVANLITARLAEHQAKEAARLEAQREQIRHEEEAKAERAAREAHDKARAAVAAIRFPTPAPEVAAELPKPAPAPAAPVAQVVRQIRPAAQAEEATLKLGEICARLGLTLTAGVIEDVLGIAPAKVEKASKLYRPSDFARICDALIAHVQKAKAGELQAG